MLLAMVPLVDGHAWLNGAGVPPFEPMVGDTVESFVVIMCPNSEAMWFIVAVLYGWSIQRTQLQVGPQLQT